MYVEGHQKKPHKFSLFHNDSTVSDFSIVFVVDTIRHTTQLICCVATPFLLSALLIGYTYPQLSILAMFHH